jgi:hypothetical protein
MPLVDHARVTVEPSDQTWDLRNRLANEVISNY